MYLDMSMFTKSHTHWNTASYFVHVFCCFGACIVRIGSSNGRHAPTRPIQERYFTCNV